MASRAQPHLSFSTQMAAQVGLEEAILHAVLGGMDTQQLNRVSQAALLQKLPWLNATDLHTLLARLHAERLINYRAVADEAYEFELLAQGVESPAQSTGQPQQPEMCAAARRAEKPYPQPSYQREHAMHAEWQPSAGSLNYLQTVAQAEDYVNEALPEFRAHYAATGECFPPGTWARRFQTWVIERKRRAEAQVADRSHAAGLSMDWTPAADYVQQLTEIGVEPGFISETLPEFRAYWSERREPRSDWNYQFQKYVRAQWARLQDNRRRGCAPAPMSEDWAPGETCLNIIRDSLIDEQFARDLIPEFRMYWLQRGEERMVWDALFLRWCKLCWGRRTDDGLNQKLRDQPFMDRLLDTDW